MTTSAPAPADAAVRPASGTYTVPQIAELLGVSERHVHRLRDQKKLPGELRIGRCVRFSRSVIDAYLSAR